MPRKTPKREETRVDGSAVSVTLADGLPDSDSTMQGDTRPLDQGQHESTFLIFYVFDLRSLLTSMTSSFGALWK